MSRKVSAIRQLNPDVHQHDARNNPDSKINIHFAELVRDQINDLNKLIEEYNQAPSCEKLQAIENQQQMMTDHYPASITRHYPGYLHAMYHTLSGEIVRERKKWRPVRAFRHDSNIVLPQDMLTDVIAIMSPNRFSRFLNILYNDKLDDDGLMQALKNLFPENMKRFQTERLQFHHFLNTHTLCLIADGHARIIKVSNLINSHACVIRARKPNRKESCRIEKHARRLLDGKIPYISPIFIERAGIIHDGSLRVIQIVPFFPNKSMFHHFMSLQNERMEPQKRLRLICTSHIQLLDFFMKYHEARLFFTDGKLENFMVYQDVKTGEYQLQVTDLKSTRTLDDDGFYQYSDDAQHWDGSLIHTMGVTPAEVVNERRCSVEKANICMLGINLYTASTCKRLKYNKKKYKVKEPTDQNFSKFLLFKTKQGQQLKQLIMDCIKHNPDDRISCMDAMTRLNQIYPYDLEQQCREQLSTLKRMDPYNCHIRHMELQVNQAADEINRSGLKQCLITLQSMMENCLCKNTAFAKQHDLEKHNLQLLENIKAIYGKYEQTGNIIPDENLKAFINTKLIEINAPQTSVTRMIEINNELNSLYNNTRDCCIKIDVLIQNTSRRNAINVLIAVRLLPVEQRLAFFSDSQDNTLLKKIIDFKACHDLLKEINSFRFENINSFPVIIDIPIRRYIHLKLEAIYAEGVSAYAMRNTRKKISDDLNRLRN